MSAGTGIRHSEYNHAENEQTHFLQIWIIPDRKNVEPGYEQKHFDAQAKRGKLTLVASADGRDGSVKIHADAAMRAGLFDGDESAELALDGKRETYVHVARGRIDVNGQTLSAGDAARIRGEDKLELAKGEGAEVLVFDLAP
jgi:redox-sensitive bicupin YhaK (pirin superfamily)